MHLIKVVVLWIFQCGLGTNEDTNVNSCVICLGSNGDLVRMCEHHCGNLFHQSCWIQCMRYDLRCPMCRRIQFSQLNTISMASDIDIPQTEPLLNGIDMTQVNASDTSRYLSRYFPLYFVAITDRISAADVMLIGACIFYVLVIIITIIHIIYQIQHG